MILSGWTMYAMMAVLAVMVLQFAIGALRALLKADFSFGFVTTFLSNIVSYVLPLLILVYLFPLDPTGLILLIVFFVAAVGVFFKVLIGLADTLKK